jgi:hypothetical protein
MVLTIIAFADIVLLACWCVMNGSKFYTYFPVDVTLIGRLSPEMCHDWLVPPWDPTSIGSLLHFAEGHDSRTLLCVVPARRSKVARVYQRVVTTNVSFYMNEHVVYLFAALSMIAAHITRLSPSVSL